ncbi:hypothetical protein D3C80_1055410 [compost metagenome]
MRPLAVARDQAPGGVVDAPGQRLASVCGAVQVEVQADAASVIQRMAEGTAQVVLVPAVFVARGIKAASERCAGVPHHTGQVETVALLAVGVVHHEALVVAGGIAVGAFVEVPGQQLERVELVAGEEEPCSGFGQQAAVGRAEYRGLDPLLAIGEHGIGRPQLQRCPCTAVFVFRVPVVIHPQQARFARAPAATVELHAQVGMGIDANTDQALGEAGLKGPHQTVGPFLGLAITFAARFVGIARGTVAPTVLVVALVEYAAVEDVPAAVFDKTAALRLRGVGQGQGRQPQQRQR